MPCPDPRGPHRKEIHMRSNLITETIAAVDREVEVVRDLGEDGIVFEFLFDELPECEVEYSF